MGPHFTRRRFLGGALAGLGAVLLPRSVPRATALRLPAIEVEDARSPVAFGTPIRLSWPAIEVGALRLRVNGGEPIPIPSGDSEYVLTPDHGAPALRAGVNTVALTVVSAEGTVSGPTTEFTVRAARGIASRGFDQEDDGPIQTTVRRAGAEIRVASEYARAAGKGVAVRGLQPHESQAHKNFVLRPVETCWIRLAFKPIRYSASNVDVPVARIGSRGAGRSIELTWRTGRDLIATGILPRVQHVRG